MVFLVGRYRSVWIYYQEENLLAKLVQQTVESLRLEAIHASYTGLSLGTLGKVPQSQHC